MQVLDKMVLYLRIVHSVDFYNHSEYPNEDEMPNRLPDADQAFFFRRESHSILFPPICPRAQVVSSTYSSFSLLGAWYIWLFYNRRFFESTFYFDFRCGILHARGIPPTAKIPSSDIDEYITSKWNDEIGVFYWGKEQLGTPRSDRELTHTVRVAEGFCSGCWRVLRVEKSFVGTNAWGWGFTKYILEWGELWGLGSLFNKSFLGFEKKMGGFLVPRLDLTDEEAMKLG